MANYFKEFMGKRVRVVSKFVTADTYICYEGIFEGINNIYMFLRDGKIIRVSGIKPKEIVAVEDFKKIMINKGIVSFVKVIE